MTDLEKILYTLRESRKVIKQNTNINTSIKITLQQIENSIYLVKNLSLSGVVDCKHDNEIMKQGDGFVYSTCLDCGDEL